MADKVDLKDINGKVVGYYCNFRVDGRGYTISDTYITDPDYDLIPIKRTIDIWIEGTNPSPVVDKKVKHIINDVRRMVEEEEDIKTIVVEGK